MSDVEIHIGKLRKVDLNNKSLEDWCKEQCSLKGITEKDSYNEDWVEQFKSELFSNEKYFIVSNQVFEAFEHKEFEYDDIYYLKDNKDGTFDFVMKFYNGGTCLSECIEEELEKIYEKDK